MTNDERIDAVEGLGDFTRRQAAFLVTVILHSGVCVQRQYDQFAGISNGSVTRRFFGDLVTRRLATDYPCARARARLYHVHHRQLYRVIGEPHSRLRKRGNVVRALERLILLDAVLTSPQLRWLATERDKVELFVKRCGISLTDLPRVTFGLEGAQTTRFFVDKLPIGVGSLGEITLMYLMADPTARAFRTFLEDHRSLLKRLQRWRVLLVGTGSSKAAEIAHRRVIHDLCAPPLPLSLSDEFRWYCETRRAIEEGRRLATDDSERMRYGLARRAFSAPRFYTAYRRWCVERDPTVLNLMTTHFYDAARRAGGVVDTLILPHAYAHLTPFVSSE